MGAIVRTNSDEHDELGYTTEKTDLTTMMMEKRMRKLDYLQRELIERGIETTRLFGGEEAEATIIGWGSTKGPIREAMRILNKEHVSVNYRQIIYLYPFPIDVVAEALSKAKKTIIVENSFTSQLSGLIRQYTLKDVDHKILRYDGRPWNPGDLAKKIKEVL
jgi:2-oxoglutarate ferredoxin oxidoreductase subunit alpha